MRRLETRLLAARFGCMKTPRTYAHGLSRHKALMMGEAGLVYLALLGIAALALFGMSRAVGEALTGIVAIVGG
jgi:hypothetical protein